MTDSTRAVLHPWYGEEGPWHMPEGRLRQLGADVFLSRGVPWLTPWTGSTTTRGQFRPLTADLARVPTADHAILGSAWTHKRPRGLSSPWITPSTSGC